MTLNNEGKRKYNFSKVLSLQPFFIFIRRVLDAKKTFDGASPKNCLNMHSAIHNIFTMSENRYDNTPVSFCRVKE